MSERLHSPNWYRVSGLRPRLRSHVRIHRHSYRDELSYVLEDLLTQRFHRFTPSAHAVLASMDGQRTVGDLWVRAGEQLGDDAPSQDELIQLLGQLHAADALKCDVPPDAADVLKRQHMSRRRKRIGQLLSPFAWRFPLLDPEKFLKRSFPYVRGAFSRAAFLLWLVVVSTGISVACFYWRDLSENVLDRVLAPQNLLWLWLLFPLFKVVHELGHAFAVKAYGGEVHDMGILFLALLLFEWVPDASLGRQT